MAEQELRQLREKFQKQEQQFQNYRDECKALQSFLEEQSNKKEKQIRKLKEEAITKQKNYKLMKTENTQLLSELSSLKAQVEKNSNKKDPSIFEQQIKDMQAELQRKNTELQHSQQTVAEQLQKIETLTSHIQQLSSSIEQKDQLAKQQQGKIHQLNEIIERQKVDNDELFTKNRELLKLQSSLKQTAKEQATVRKGKEKEQTSHLEWQLQQTKAKHEEKLKRYEEKMTRMERIIKQLKQRLQEALQVQQTSPNKPSTEKSIESAFKMYIGCLIITKPHYLSPFLDVNEETKTLKLFKPARNGCFEKALGSTRHRFSMLTYEKNEVVEDIVRRIKTHETDSPHLVLIFGTKKSAKKNLFVDIIAQLYDFLTQKLRQSDEADCSALYIRKSHEQNCEKEEAFSKEQIVELLEKMTNTSGSELRRSERLPSSRKPQKPRVAYFSLRIGQFLIEVATSSFTNISLKQKDDASTFYNNVLYSKLPNVLQSAYGEKYLVFTLNPIVDLYDDCKNILSVTACKSLFMSPSKAERELESPNKELLNTIVRRKLQSYERQIEQGQLRIKKVEDECAYYRSRFSDLEERLKNLISTHHAQNAYLKKSPILLSYQKMLKFVHSVQSKTVPTTQTTGNVINLDQIDFNDQHQECL